MPARRQSDHPGPGDRQRTTGSTEAELLSPITIGSMNGMQADPRVASRPVLLVASSGGHLLQLVQFRDLWPIEQRRWVTFDRPDARSLLAGEFVVPAHHPTNRSLKNLLKNLWLAIRTVRSLKPRAIVTTGAGVAVPFCMVGRLSGAHIVYIESLTRIDKPSLTGRLVEPMAHDFFIQWPELASHYHKATYEGTVFDLSEPRHP